MGSGKRDDNWASDDDANDLLAGILDETEEDARSEQERIEAELAAKEERRRREQEEQRERKRAEARARITAEEERLEGLEKRRTLRQEALRIEDLKERGEYVEEEPEEAEGPTGDESDARRQSELEEARRREQEERHRRELAEAQAAQQTAVEAQLASNQSSNKMAVLALAAVFVLVAGAGATAFMLAQGSYEPDASVYSKSVYEPREPKDMQVSVGFTPINEQEEMADTPRVAPKTPTSRPNPPPASHDSGSDDEPEESSRPTLPDFDESGFDPFGEDI